MNVTLESIFRLDPLSKISDVMFEEFDPELYFESYEGFIDDIITEASLITRKGITERLISIISKAFKYLMKIVNNLISGFRRLLSGRARSANQIARSVGMVYHETISTKADPNDPNLASSMAGNLYTNFIEGITKDGILIKPSALVKIDPRITPIKGKDIAGAGVRASQVLELILNPRVLDEYMEFFNRLTSDVSSNAVTKEDVDRIYKSCKSFVGRPSIASYAKNAIKPAVNKEHESILISITELMDFQKKVGDMDSVCEKVDDVFKKLNISFAEDPKVKEIEIECTKILNELSWASVNLQGGLHAISNGMKGIYQLDSGYKGVIDKPEVLANFVSEALKTGMPGKYLVNNIYLACHPSIKGYPDVNKPLMGFGRLTLLPKGDIIYKVAINQYGIRSNKNDFAVMNAVKGTPISHMFADTTMTHDYIVNVMEKIKAGSAFEPNPVEAAKLGEAINKGLEDMDVGFKIYDIKSDAFGTKDGKYVILDYGYLHRRNFGVPENQ